MSGNLKVGMRVRVLESRDPRDSGTAKVVWLLPNPSGKPENQWYDVRFDNGRWGRFPARLVERADSSAQTSAA
jgi:hypothetical protein